MAKQTFSLLFVAVLAQTFIVTIDASSPNYVGLQKRSLNERYFGGACDGYPYGGGYGGYGSCYRSPFISDYDNSYSNVNQNSANLAYQNSDHLSANICQDHDTAYVQNNDNSHSNSAFTHFNTIAKRDLGYKKRFYGDCGYGNCYGGPYIANYDNSYNGANQQSANLAYQNSDHLSASICQDHDTAFVQNNDNSHSNSAFTHFNTIAKHDLGYKKRFYGGCDYGGFRPYIANYDNSRNNINQQSANLAFENSEHLSANICQDDETAYFQSNNHADSANAFSNHDIIA